MIDNTFMLQTTVGEEDKLICAAAHCRRSLGYLERYFVDTLKKQPYCDQCGKCLRYSRKKALERGEPVERAEVM